LDLGTIESTYKGKPKKTHAILVSWELYGDGTATKEGHPMMASKRYTFSLADKAILRKDIESWRAKPLTEAECENFDIFRLLGSPAFITLANSDDGKYLNVTGVGKIIKGTPVPEKTHNKLTSLALVPGEFDQAVYDNLSDGLKEAIAKTPEYQALKGGKPVTADRNKSDLEDEFGDELPF
jgi:hypothetical protein